MDWHTAGINDLELLQKCALNNNLFANNYSAVNSILYSEKYHSRIAIESEWIYEKFCDGTKPVFCFPHNINGNNADLKKALDLLLKDSGEGFDTWTFTNITAQEKELLSGLYEITEAKEIPDFADYIYLTENLASLPGSKYSKKRNHINQFKKKYSDFKLELITQQNLSTAYEIGQKWFEENMAPEFIMTPSQEETIKLERKIFCTAFKNFEQFSKLAQMKGTILFVNNEPVAFCLSSLLCTDVTDIHFEKCLAAYAKDGAYAIINNEYAKTISTKYINREEDLGIEGLRKAKNSYYPQIFLDKYEVTIK